jgi:uncharacterized membrane protein
MENNKKTTAEAKGNVTAALTYLFGWLTGLIFLLTEKEDDFVRFHAAQSIVVFGSVTIISFVPLIGQLLALILWPVSLVLWIVLMVKAYNNEKFELPFISGFAKKLEAQIK